MFKKVYFLLFAITLTSTSYAEVYLYYPNSTLYLGGNFDPSRPGEVFPDCLKPSSVRHESEPFFNEAADASGPQQNWTANDKVKNTSVFLEKQKALIEAQKVLLDKQGNLVLLNQILVDAKKDASSDKKRLEAIEQGIKRAEEEVEKVRKNFTDEEKQSMSFPVRPSATDTYFFMRYISSREELYKTLGLSLSLAGNYGFFEGAMKFGLDQKNTFDKDSFTWVIQGYSNFGKFMLTQAELKEGHQKGGSNLRKKCGTSYVAQEVRGAQASAIFTVRNITEKERSELRTYLNAGYNAGGSRATVQVDFSNLIDRLAKSSQIEVNVHAIGGKGVGALAPIITQITDSTAVLKTLEDYFKGLTIENAVSVSYRTGSLETLTNGEGPTIDTETYNKYISNAYLAYADLTAEEERLRGLLNNRLNTAPQIEPTKKDENANKAPHPQKVEEASDATQNKSEHLAAQISLLTATTLKMRAQSILGIKSSSSRPTNIGTSAKDTSDTTAATNYATVMNGLLETIIPDASNNADFKPDKQDILKRAISEVFNKMPLIDASGYDIVWYLAKLGQSKERIVQAAKDCKDKMFVESSKDEYHPNNEYKYDPNKAKEKCTAPLAYLWDPLLKFSRVRFNEQIVSNPKPYQLTYNLLNEDDRNSESIAFFVSGQNIKSVQAGANPSSDENFEMVKDYMVEGAKDALKVAKGSVYMYCVPQKKTGLRIEMFDGTRYFEPLKDSRADSGLWNFLRCSVSR